MSVLPYETRNSNAGKSLADGWADWPAFLIKYRILSANEEQGNYIVSGFFQLSADREMALHRSLLPYFNQR